jgi:hypothetical protein
MGVDVNRRIFTNPSLSLNDYKHFAKSRGLEMGKFRYASRYHVYNTWVKGSLMFADYTRIARPLAQTTLWGVCLLLALLGLSSADAHAQGKAKVAILGLEVQDSGTGPRQGQGPYYLAPGSERELVDQKVMTGCDDEKAECMARIGKELGADQLIYGKVKREARAFQITLFLLDVTTKRAINQQRELAFAVAASDAELEASGRALYSRLIGQPQKGTIVVRATAQSGTVKINGSVKGQLSNGTARVDDIDEGACSVVVESEGKETFTSNVSVRGGEDTIVTANLKDAGGTVIDREGTIGQDNGSGSSGRGWAKGMFYGGLVVGAAGGGYWAYQYFRPKSAIEKGENSVGFGDCFGTPPDKTENLCKRQKGTALGMGMVGVGAVFASVGYYYAFVKESSTPARSASRKRRKIENVVVTPVISPDGAGAVMRFDF